MTAMCVVWGSTLESERWIQGSGDPIVGRTRSFSISIRKTDDWPLVIILNPIIPSIFCSPFNPYDPVALPRKMCGEGIVYIHTYID